MALRRSVREMETVMMLWAGVRVVDLDGGALVGACMLVLGPALVSEDLGAHLGPSGLRGIAHGQNLFDIDERWEGVGSHALPNERCLRARRRARHPPCRPRHTLSPWRRARRRRPLPWSSWRRARRQPSAFSRRITFFSRRFLLLAAMAAAAAATAPPCSTRAAAAFCTDEGAAPPACGVSRARTRAFAQAGATRA